MKQIGEDFMHKVYDVGNGSVVKIPKNSKKSSVEGENASIATHRKYLGDAIPETRAWMTSNGFKIEQEMIKGELIDLIPGSVTEDVFDILEKGAEMQRQENQLFDVFGLEGLVQVFRYFEDGETLGKMNELFLPLNKLILEHAYKMPKLTLDNILQKSESPFLSHNLIRTHDGEIKFIDTDYRALDWKNPLHILGNIYTQKALKLIREGRNSSK